jgi:hypothetical protein
MSRLYRRKRKILATPADQDAMEKIADPAYDRPSSGCGAMTLGDGTSVK